MKSLPERHDIGRATSREDEEKLMEPIRQVRSPALMPLFIVAIDSGLRTSEIRSLRHCDLKLICANGVISSGEIIVPKSKTEAGTGRLVPLTPCERRAKPLAVSISTQSPTATFFLSTALRLSDRTESHFFATWTRRGP